jgi:hypothetical protein
MRREHLLEYYLISELKNQVIYKFFFEISPGQVQLLYFI